ncbi:MAG: ATP-binding protein [Candidatus Aenigmarchaeota archaeon]|nr:ATP-binding protein [Candidatus Aenigmarchaeota archaeon]
MSQDELKVILQKGEGQFIEFKESAKGLDKEIVAFANAGGGKLFVGITDKNEIKGINITNKLKSDVQDIARNCDPSINIILRK